MEQVSCGQTAVVLWDVIDQISWRKHSHSGSYLNGQAPVSLRDSPVRERV